MQRLWLLALLAAGPALADVYVGDLGANKCTVQKGKEFRTVLRDSQGDKGLEVTHEKTGRCGESAYVIRTASRKRHALFPTKTGCECYLQTAQLLSPTK